jgi:hypothetical protein
MDASRISGFSLVHVAPAARGILEYRVAAREFSFTRVNIRFVSIHKGRIRIFVPIAPSWPLRIAIPSAPTPLPDFPGPLIYLA